MRRLGLLGGMSWESSIEYERIIHTRVRERLGGTASADILLRAFNFAEIEQLQSAGRWDDAARMLANAAQALQAAGADAIMICSNTMHRLAQAVADAVTVPLLHIVDPTGEAVRAHGLDRVALLGTRFTMEDPFYADRLRDQHEVSTIVPDAQQRQAVHDIIYSELVQGVITEQSRAVYRQIIDDLIARGAQGVIAGCTEIELLVRPSDCAVPLFPTARLHAEAAADWALASEGAA